VDKIINLKFKRALRKSTFGKIYGGAGTRDRYSAGGLFNMFRDTLQISVLGQTNNLKRYRFLILMIFINRAGFNRGGSETFYRGGLSFFGRLKYRHTKSSIGRYKYYTDYGKKLKINLSYYYTRTHTDNSSLNNRQQFLTDTNLVTNTTSSGIQTSNAHNVSVLVRWQPNDATQLTYHPALSYSDRQSGSNSTVNSYSNYIPQIALTNNSSSSTGNTLQFQHTFDYNHQFKNKGESINVSHNLSINPDDGMGYTINDLHSYTTALSSFLLNRNNNMVNRNTSVNLGANLPASVRQKNHSQHRHRQRLQPSGKQYHYL